MNMDLVPMTRSNSSHFSKEVYASIIIMDHDSSGHNGYGWNASGLRNSFKGGN